MKVHFQLDEHQIEVVPTRRRGSIGLKVEPNRIALMVPQQMTAEAVHSLITTQQEWLRQQINLRHAELPDVFEFADGVEVWLWGECFTLRLKLAEKNDILLDVKNKQLEISFKATKKHPKLPLPLLKKRLEKWFVANFQVYLDEKLPEIIKRVGVEVSEVKVRSYKGRWGSCYPDGRLQFNWRLVMAPKWVVDYVMVHEVCHLIHANHSKDYWALVAAHYPNYQEAKNWLKQHGAKLIHF